MTVLNADRWLYTQLTTDAQLVASLGGRVFVDTAPQGTEYPLVIMTRVIARQVGNWSADRIMDEELWQIAVWTNQNNYSSIGSIADRIYTVLHKASGTGVIGCVYESSKPMSDPEGYKAIVIEFRLFTQ